MIEKFPLYFHRDHLRYAQSINYTNTCIQTPEQPTPKRSLLGVTSFQPA